VCARIIKRSDLSETFLNKYIDELPELIEEIHDFKEDFQFIKIYPEIIIPAQLVDKDFVDIKSQFPE
jgi:hypothetical protein